MGLFKQIKDMKSVVAEAPGMVAQAQQLAGQAQALQAAHLAAAQASGASLADAGVGGAVTPAELEPIAGVSLERYAQLAKSIGERRLQGSSLESFLADHGHRERDWQESYDGWNARMKANLALSRKFAALYQRAVAL